MKNIKYITNFHIIELNSNLHFIRLIVLKGQTRRPKGEGAENDIAQKRSLGKNSIVAEVFISILCYLYQKKNRI